MGQDVAFLTHVHMLINNYFSIPVNAFWFFLLS